MHLPIIRLLALIALAVSAAQLADSLTAAGAFCPFEGECEAVTSSPYGHPLGIPLPAVGVVGFALLFALTLPPNPRAVRLVRPLALAAGVAGVVLLVIQVAVLGRLCPLCVVVDLCSIGLAVAVLVRRLEPAPPVRLQLAVWIAAGVGMVFFPLLWSLSEMPPPPPEELAKYWEPGRITVLEVTDFDCSHCQNTDAILRQVRTQHDVRVVRRPAPMPNHENARPAARAYVAAARQGKGDQMATGLFTADTRTPARCRELAAEFGLNLAEYDRVVGDPATDAELDANVTWAKGFGSGLPHLWIQEKFLAGTPTPEALDAALRQARPYRP